MIGFEACEVTIAMQCDTDKTSLSDLKSDVITTPLK
jgi:hypothetical protein